MPLRGGAAFPHSAEVVSMRYALGRYYPGQALRVCQDCWSTGMMPHFDVESSVDYAPERLLVLAADEIADGFAMVRDYEHLKAFSWGEVEEGLRAERSVLDHAARDARTESEFEDHLVAAGEDA